MLVYTLAMLGSFGVAALLLFACVPPAPTDELSEWSRKSSDTPAPVRASSDSEDTEKGGSLHGGNACGSLLRPSGVITVTSSMDSDKALI